MNPLRLLLLCLVPAVAPVFAQSTEGEPAVAASLRFLSMDEGEVEGLWIYNRDEWTPVRVPSGYLASPIRYAGPARLVFHREREQPEEGEALHMPVGAVALPQNRGEQLVLLHTNDRGAVDGRSVDIGSDRFPDGAYLVFNLCDRAVALGMADEVYTLAPQQAKVLRPSVEGREPISVQFIKAGDKDRDSLVTTTWFHDPVQRQLVFLVPVKERIDVRALTLFPEPAADAD